MPVQKSDRVLGETPFERKLSSRTLIANENQINNILERKSSRMEINTSRLRVDQPFDTRSMSSLRSASKMSMVSENPNIGKSEEEKQWERRERFW